MKIVHVLNSLTIGGREKVVIELCNELVKTNEIVVITLTNDENLQKIKLDKNIRLIELPFKSDLKGIFQLWVQGFFLLKKHFTQIKPDIVHNHLYYQYYLFLALVSKSINKKYKSFRTIHTSGLFYSNGGLLNRFRLGIEKLATRIDKPNLISISQAVYNNNNLHFKTLISNNKYIPNGINFNELDKKLIPLERSLFNLAQEDFVGVYVARLDDGKNHRMVIEAVEKLSSLNLSIKILFVGDGNLRGELEHLTGNKNLQQYIHFIGFADNVASYLKMADFGIFPSEFEGFGLSLIEKMYYKLPVIVSNIDVFLEIIKNGDNGIVFNLQNPTEFTDNLIELHTNRKKNAKLGEKARESVLIYDIKNIVCQTLNYYN